MIKTAVARILTAAPALPALVPAAAWAHDIEALHVHESHIVQGLGLAVLVALVLGAVFVARRWRRR